MCQYRFISFNEYTTLGGLRVSIMGERTYACVGQGIRLYTLPSILLWNKDACSLEVKLWQT